MPWWVKIASFRIGSVYVCLRVCGVVIHTDIGTYTFLDTGNTRHITDMASYELESSLGNRIWGQQQGDFSCLLHTTVFCLIQ